MGAKLLPDAVSRVSAIFVLFFCLAVFTQFLSDAVDAPLASAFALRCSGSSSAPLGVLPALSRLCRTAMTTGYLTGTTPSRCDLKSGGLWGAWNCQEVGNGGRRGRAGTEGERMRGEGTRWYSVPRRSCTLFFLQRVLLLPTINGCPSLSGSSSLWFRGIKRWSGRTSVFSCFCELRPVHKAYSQFFSAPGISRRACSGHKSSTHGTS